MSIKAMPESVRSAMVKAAREENLTVAQWLVRERENVVENRSNRPAQASGVGELLAILAEARAMAAAPDVPLTLKRAVYSMAREAIRRARGLPPVPPRRLTAESE
jgi:hypothetical protein